MRTLLALGFVFLLSLLLLLSLGADGKPVFDPKGNADDDYVEWVLPIFIAESSEKELESLASSLFAGTHPAPPLSRIRRNPVCGLWVEVDGWEPNPGCSGYVIVIQKGGGRIVASDLAQLKLAIKNLKERIVYRDNKIYMPIGLMTNYALMKPAR